MSAAAGASSAAAWLAVCTARRVNTSCSLTACVPPLQRLKTTVSVYCCSFGALGGLTMKALLGERVQLLMPV